MNRTCIVKCNLINEKKTVVYVFNKYLLINNKIICNMDQYLCE